MTDKPAQSVDLTPATGVDMAILANLYQLYVYDFTHFVDLPLGENGRFVYDPLPPYATAPNRFAFLVRVGGKLSGFALVKKGSEFSGNNRVWDMADFFVIRGARRGGVGYEVAATIWQRFAGPWEIRVIPANTPALHFWSKAITRFTGSPAQPKEVSRGGETRYVFEFETPTVESAESTEVGH